jgi:outer membrane receptor protein involved in Fe transport
MRAAFVLVAASLAIAATSRADERDSATAAPALEPPALEPPAPAAEEADEAEALPTFGARARVSRVGVDEIDPSASGTTLSLSERPRALETLDEILREAPGARARRTSSYGGFSTLSLRGADAEHTAVLLGDLPLIAADGTAVDLSTLPPWMFERVEIYRGGAPVWLGSGAIGGVLRLVPRSAHGARVELGAGLGSFDRFQGRASIAAGDRALGVLAGASLVSAGNGFPYLDDNGTALVPGDDRERARQNAQLLEGSALAHVGARVLDGRLSLIGTLLERTGGLAPPPSRFVDAPIGRRSSERLTLGASMDWLEGARDLGQASEARWRIAAAVGVGLEARGVSDPLAQFGQLSREARDHLLRAHARVAGTVAITEELALTAMGQYVREELASRDRLLDAADPARARTESQRDTAALALEPRLALRFDDVRIEGRVSGRLEGAFATLRDPSGERGGEAQRVELALPTGRASVLVEIVRAVSIVGSVSVGTRAPSSLELFGDRGYLAGNVLLRPETSYGGELGVVVAGRAEVVRGRLELRGFASHLEDLVRYQRVAQNQAVPLNVLDARLVGLEAGVSGDLLGHVRLDGALTLLDARDLGTDLALPLRPSVVGYVRLEGHVDGPEPGGLGTWSGGRVYVEIEHVGASTADPAALVRIPDRSPFGLGVSVSFFDDWLRVDALVRDVADVRGYDVLGLPLPGRSFALELTAAGW